VSGCPLAAVSDSDFSYPLHDICKDIRLASCTKVTHRRKPAGHTSDRENVTLLLQNLETRGRQFVPAPSKERLPFVLESSENGCGPGRFDVAQPFDGC